MDQEAFDWSSAETFFGMLLGDNYEFSRIVKNGESASHECLLPRNIGTGRMEFVAVRPDFKVVILDCTWHCNKEIRVRDGGWARFNFNKTSEVDVTTTANSGKKLALSSWNILSLPKDISSLERVKPGAKTTFLTAACSLEHICRITGISEKDLPKPLHTLYDENTCESFVSSFELTQQIGLATQQAIHTDLDSGARVSFITAKATELMCLTLDNLLSQKPEYPRSFVKLTGSDEQKIRKAKAYLDKSLKNQPSVAEIALAVGINRNKLFYGFKFLTGHTISQYLQGMKLKRSYDLLVNTDMDIGEVADSVGFKHQCNFSTAFKAFFGITPTSLRSSGGVKVATTSHL